MLRSSSLWRGFVYSVTEFSSDVLHRGVDVFVCVDYLCTWDVVVFAQLPSFLFEVGALWWPLLSPIGYTHPAMMLLLDALRLHAPSTTRI
jgi:hypothetical protein